MFNIIDILYIHIYRTMYHVLSHAPLFHSAQYINLFSNMTLKDLNTLDFMEVIVWAHIHV